jgi:hypothetical protein
VRCRNKYADVRMFICIVVSFGLAGCGTAPVRHADWSVPENGRVLRKAAWGMDDLSRRRRSMRALVKISAPFLPGKTAADGVIVVQPLDLIRLDVMDPAGGLLAGLHLKLDALDLWMPRQMRVFEADSSDDSIAHITKLPWTLSELFSILQGMPPRRFNEEFTDWSIDPDGYAVNGDGDAIMALEPGLNLPQSFIRYKNDRQKKAIYEVLFEDYRATNLGMFPHHITLRFLGKRKTVELWFENVEWNPVVAWGALAPEYPEGTRVVRVR